MHEPRPSSRAGDPSNPSDIADHLQLASETRPGDWIDWLECAGLSHLAAEQRRRVFDHFFVTLQAVVDGLGVGIGPFPDARQRPRRRADRDTLSRRSGSRRTGYVALVPFDADKNSLLTSFIDWLIAEGAG